MGVCVEETAAMESCVESNSCSSLCTFDDDEAGGMDVDAGTFDCAEFKSELQDATCTSVECCPACSDELVQLTQCSVDALKVLFSVFGGPEAASCDFSIASCNGGSGGNGGGASSALDVIPGMLSSAILAAAGGILFMLF